MHCTSQLTLTNIPTIIGLIGGLSIHLIDLNQKTMFYKISFLSLLMFVLGICYSNESQAQDYAPILEPTAVWTQGTSGGWPNGTVTYGYSKYRLQGDTVINGTTYQKMYASNNELAFNPSTATYRFAIRENDQGQVWIHRQNDTEEILYMDFSLEVGDTGMVFGENIFDGSNTSPGLVLAKDSVLIGSEYRTRLQVQMLPGQYCITEYWIEGIGNTGGFLRDLASCFISDIGFKQLICHELDGVQDYLVSWANTCELPFPITIYDFVFTDETICIGQEIEISGFPAVGGGVGPYSFSVEPEEGLINANSFGVTVNPTETTDYTFTVTDVLGNNASADFTVTVIDDPIEPVEIITSSFSNDCYVDSLLLSTNGIYDSYTWTNINGNVVGSTPNLVIYEPGNYYLEVANSSGCTTSAFKAFLFQDPLNTNPSPVIVIEPSQPCDGDIVTISTKEAYTSYLWSTGETTPTLQVPVSAGSFYSISVQVTNEFGCVGPNVTSTIGYGALDFPQEPNIIQDGNTLSADIAETIGTYQWYLNDEPIEGANEETYTAEESGDYSLGVSLSSYGLDCPTFSESLAVVVSSRPVEITVLLEGAYNDATGLMKTDLLTNDLLPLSQPYNMAPWNYTGEESVASNADFPANTVDWVLIEARSGIPDLANASTTVVETKAALLLANGQVVGLDGETLQFNQLGPTDYLMAVRHRNHLDILSAATSPSNATIFHDFTAGTNEAFGPFQLKEMADGKTAMHAGDYSPNGVILNTDYDNWAVNPAINQVYALTDGNLDGVVQATDFDQWFVNKAKLGIIEIQY